MSCGTLNYIHSIAPSNAYNIITVFFLFHLTTFHILISADNLTLSADDLTYLRTNQMNIFY